MVKLSVSVVLHNCREISACQGSKTFRNTVGRKGKSEFWSMTFIAFQTLMTMKNTMRRKDVIMAEGLLFPEPIKKREVLLQYITE